MTVSVGIAGWSYADWKDVVYPRGCRDPLAHCLRYVDGIEINASFYATPPRRRCARWADRARQADTWFTAKLPRAFTHEGALGAEAAGAVVDAFEPLLESGVLRCWLAQFSHRFDARPASRAYLRRLVAPFAARAPVAIEVRHRSWQRDEALAFLRELGVSAVHLDYPGASTGFGLRHTGVLGPERIAYVRLHGRNARDWFRKGAGRDEVYDYDYSTAEVEDLAAWVREIEAGAARVLVVANNHFRGQAMKTALEIVAALRGTRVAVPEPLLRTWPVLRGIASDPPRGLFGAF